MEEVLGLERAQARAVQTQQGTFCIITISTLKLTLNEKMSSHKSLEVSRGAGAGKG